MSTWGEIAALWRPRRARWPARGVWFRQGDVQALADWAAWDLADRAPARTRLYVPALDVIVLKGVVLASEPCDLDAGGRFTAADHLALDGALERLVTSLHAQGALGRYRRFTLGARLSAISMTSRSFIRLSLCMNISRQVVEARLDAARELEP